ncbi:hypothetical protein ES707_09593 [subsurface metagenome]
MPEIIPDHVPSPRTLLAWDGTAYRPIHIDALGNVQIDVVASALPAGAATEATLASADAYLALITLIRNALQSVETDRLIVRGEDQLFSYKEAYHSRTRHDKVGAGNWLLDCPVVGPGEIWKLTSIFAYSRTAVCTSVTVAVLVGATEYEFHHEPTPVAFVGNPGPCEIWLDAGERIRATFIACGAAEVLICDLNGHVMTLET